MKCDGCGKDIGNAGIDKSYKLIRQNAESLEPETAQLCVTIERDEDGTITETGCGPTAWRSGHDAKPAPKQRPKSDGGRSGDPSRDASSESAG